MISDNRQEYDGTMTLEAFFEQRFLPERLADAAASAHFYRTALRNLTAYLGHEATLDDVTGEALIGLRVWLAGRGVKHPEDYGQRIRAVLRHATGCERVAVEAVEHPPGSLAAYIDTYALENDVTKGHIYQLRLSVARLDEWAGAPVMLRTITSDLINAWILEQQQEGTLSRSTIHGRRGNVLTLWRAAHEAGLAPPLGKVRTVKKQLASPYAWTIEEVQRLLAMTALLEGRMTRGKGPERRPFCRAFILTAWDTGLRLSDIFRLRFDQIGDGSQVIVCQKKTGRLVVCRMRPSTVRAIEAIAEPAREFIFAGVLCSREWQFQFANIVGAAGLTGGSHKLRKSAASYVEREYPGAGAAFLGHARGVAEQHYLDPRITVGKRPLPPPLIDDDKADATEAKGGAA